MPIKQRTRKIWNKLRSSLGLNSAMKHEQQRQAALLDQLLPAVQEMRARLDEATQSQSTRLAEHSDRIDHRLAGMDTALTGVSQYLDIITTESVNITPPPPKHLQERVVGCYSPKFIASGAASYKSFHALLANSGRSFSEFRTVLDFGCGCGRLIRGLKQAHPDIDCHGADIDAEAIGWLQKNYSNIGSFRTLPHLPPTSYGDSTFDFIYGVSVFTHLPEDMQFAWLAELARIAKPGALVFLTTHGQKHWGKFTGVEAETMKQHGFYYREANRTDGLTEFYKNTYHAHSYIRDRWSQFFNIIDIVELGLEAHQDVVLATPRKGANASSAHDGQERNSLSLPA